MANLYLDDVAFNHSILAVPVELPVGPRHSLTLHCDLTLVFAVFVNCFACNFNWFVGQSDPHSCCTQLCYYDWRNNG